MDYIREGAERERMRAAEGARWEKKENRKGKMEKEKWFV